MKPLKRIIILFVAVSAIVLLWLVPGINTARNVTYTRIYEDTDKIAVPDTAGRKISARQEINTSAQTKKYKQESIKAGEELSKIDPSMFSRAIHFKEEKIISEVDSLEEIQLTVVMDSVDQIQ
ncbi:MAG TPA: hypothetical protein VGK59_07140 [Ohtaekwangia sp.]